jgi:3D (Asp-Asp-Asp) domain-containing protein/type II secretory pathway pseudopilin PulG
MSRKQHIILTAIITVVAIIGASCVVSAIHLSRIRNLQAEIDSQKSQVAYYQTAYNQAKEDYGTATENYNKVKAVADKVDEYKTDITNKVKQIENLSKEKEELALQAGKLENTVKSFAALGPKPLNYTLPEKISRGSFDRLRGSGTDRLKLLGIWLGTFYAPNARECGNNRGITASGEPIQPGGNIAVDTKYWKLGTKFYIEGFGLVTATDTGSAIKGKNRFDYAVFNTNISHSGSFKAKVWLVSEPKN